MSDGAARPQNLLIVEPRGAVRAWLAALGAELGCRCSEAGSAEQARLWIDAGGIEALLLSHELPARERQALLRELRSLRPDVAVVELAEAAGPRTIVESLRAGSAGFLVWPFEADDLARALASCASRRAEARPPAAPGAEAGFVAPGERMAPVLRRIAAVAGTDLTVLIRGESGTGKELAARAIWAGSARRARPFVRVCCAAIPEELLESELFGWERGAFTGAQRRRLGRIHAADGGTLFLDEIGELSPRMQAKLLQVLQDGRFGRLGGEGEIAVDARVIASTRCDLDAAVTSGRFRDDLYYRLNVVSIRMPPLRERREEILPLALHFARRFAREFARDLPLPSAELRRLLLAHSWPGNVRELENLIQRLVVLGAERGLLEELRARAADAPPRADVGALERFLSGETPTLSLRAVAREAARRAEAEHLARVLEKTGGNRQEAAEILQISYKALLYRMRDAGLGQAPPQA